MILRALGQHGPLVSEIGLGTLHFGAFVDQRQATELVHKALDCNVTFFDTAPIYGNARSESILGGALQGKRSKAVVSTKVGLAKMTHPDGRFGVQTVPLSKELLRTSVESSLRALRIDTIDLLQLHAFDHGTTVMETLQGLEDLILSGKVRYFGSSNYNLEELKILIENLPISLRNKYVSFQAHYNLVERRAEDELLPTCAKYGLGMIVNRALARGLLTGKYLPGKQFPEKSRGVISHRVRDTITEEILELIGALNDFSQSMGHSFTELALNWALRSPEISVALVGVRDCGQLTTCINATDWKLLPDEIIEINKIIENFGFSRRVRQMPENFFEQ